MKTLAWRWTWKSQWSASTSWKPQSGRRRPVKTSGLRFSSGQRWPDWGFHGQHKKIHYIRIKKYIFFFLINVNHRPSTSTRLRFSWSMSTILRFSNGRCQRCRRPVLLRFSSRPKRTDNYIMGQRNTERMEFYLVVLAVHLKEPYKRTQTVALRQAKFYLSRQPAVPQ